MFEEELVEGPGLEKFVWARVEHPAKFHRWLIMTTAQGMPS
jgi:hypothetical protein